MTASYHVNDPPASELSPVLGARWALTGKHLAVCLLFGGLFAYSNYRPLLDSSIWLHVCQGRWTLEHHALPDEDAAQPLTEGMRVLVTCWLSQVAFSAAESWGGPQFVSNLFALASLAHFLILARVFYLLTRRVSLMMVGIGMVFLLGRHDRSCAGPEVFGQLCLAALLWLVVRLNASSAATISAEGGGADTSRRAAWGPWLATAGLFVVWANLHGSFLAGIAVLACCALARATEVGWTTRSARSVVFDRLTQRWLLLAEWAAVATLLNPHGLDLVLENVRLFRNEHLRQMPQWLPLELPAFSGVLFLTSVVVLAAVFRHSHRRVHPVEVLLLLAFGAAVISTARAMDWYAPVFTFVLMPHLADILTRVLPAGNRTAPSPEKAAIAPGSFVVTLICALVLWCAFAFSPISQGVLGGTPRKAEHILGRETPRGVAEYLREHPAEGLIFAPLRWADWLVWAGAPGTQVYATSNVQWVPQRVWRDYRRIARAAPGWDRALDRYAVHTVIVHKSRQESLRRSVQRSEKWTVVFEDEMALIAQRAEQDLPQPTGEDQCSDDSCLDDPPDG